MYSFIHSSVEVHVWVGAVQIELSMSRIRLHISIMHALSGSGWAFVGACAFLGNDEWLVWWLHESASMGRDGMDSVEGRRRRIAMHVLRPKFGFLLIFFRLQTTKRVCR